MRWIDTQGIRLAVESFGDPGNPALLLVMGATASMLGWPDEFCTALADRGLHVTRFDHRDTGQSTTVAPGAASYAVEDLASDALAILNSLGPRRVHLCGMSLGGYLSQMLAVSHPDRVASLTLIASEPLGWDGQALPHISPAILTHFGGLAGLDWTDKAAVARFLLTTEQLCAGEGEPVDTGREANRIRQVMARTESTASMFNHAAMGGRKDWTGRYRDITCPTLILHGDRDPVLPIENGRALAQGIPGAVLVELAGVGHSLPPSHLTAMADRIAAHAQAAGAGRGD